MTWFFSPIKSTDTNTALFPRLFPRHHFLVLSTDQIYHLAALRLGDKFDRSMTLGKLLGNNAPLFIFIS